MFLFMNDFVNNMIHTELFLYQLKIILQVTLLLVKTNNKKQINEPQIKRQAVIKQEIYLELDYLLFSCR